MKRFKGFGARRSGFEIVNPGSNVKKISQVVDFDSPPVFDSPRNSSSTVDRRRSVEYQGTGVILESGRERGDDGGEKMVESKPRVSRDWRSPLRGMISSRSSFSSSFDFRTSSSSSSSSRPSDASLNSASSSETVFQQDAGLLSGRAVVIGFDANVGEALVSAVAWAFLHVLRKGDVLALIGVMEYLRGPLGYKCQVNDQTWLGANRNFLSDEIGVKVLAWSALPGLKSLCEERGVKLVVNVKASQRPEVVIVQEAIAMRAVQLVLDKSLNNRRRRYYLERLNCDVTRMRRSGGSEALRATMMHHSPTSVIPLSYGAAAPSAELVTRDLTSSLSRLAEENPASSSTFTPSGFTCTNPTFLHDDDELFTIDHATAHNPHPIDLHRHSAAYSMDDGYESDDLFSISGDTAWRSTSFASLHRPPVETQSARNSTVAGHDPAMECFIPSRSSLDSGPRLDKRLLSSFRVDIGE